MLLSKRTKDLTNQTFGSLTAIKPTKKVNNMLYWEFRCQCGNIHEARGNTIVHQSKLGKQGIPSCGCVELANKTKHGKRTVKHTHPIYRAWRGMIDRCTNPKSASYKWYGAKGVTICPEWLNSFETFYEWSINNGWKKGLHIDKDIINKDAKVYSPSTCQWTTAKVNVGNATNRNNYGKHPNVKLSHAQVAEILELYFSGKETNQSELARKFGLLSPSSIGRLIRAEKKKRAGSNAPV